jgi:protein gp37
VYGIADRAWQPLIGCNEDLPCAAHCWAKRTANRLGHAHSPEVREAHEGLVRIMPYRSGDAKLLEWTGVVRLNELRLLDPLGWRQPAVVATGYHGDIALLSDKDKKWVFAVEALCPHLRFIHLTKRPRELWEYFREPRARMTEIFRAAMEIGKLSGALVAAVLGEEGRVNPPDNWWFGISAEDQPRLDERAPWLMRLAGAGWNTWLSAEPLVGPMNMTRVNHTVYLREQLVDFARWDVERTGKSVQEAVARAAESVTDQVPAGEKPYINLLTGEWFDGWDTGNNGPKLGLVVVGGESGPGARACRIEWIENIIEQCRAAGTPCFVKQLGAYPVWAGAKCSPLQPGKGKNHNPLVWPLSLRVQEMPEGLRV